MTRITVDGIDYTPATVTSSSPPIGIAITTRNRPDILKRARQAWTEHLPPGAPFFIVDDASDKPVDDAAYRFDQRAGIAAAKNKCIELLMDTDADHLFLFDDDTWPKTPDWWRPYVDHPEPHLTHSWNLVEHYRDNHPTTGIVSTHAAGGTVIYLTRHVVNTVGGMATDLGKYGREHVNLSDRIYSAGLTTWRYQDIPAATDGNLFYELDRHEKTRTKSTATPDDISHDAGPGRQDWISRRHDTTFVPYRAPRRRILTDLYTRSPDPQRGRVTGLTAKSIHALANSVHSIDQTAIVCFTDISHPVNITGVEWVPSTARIRIDFQRWVNVATYLRDHPDLDQVWHVDATDVEMTLSPWEHMEPGRLYVGSETDILASEWMLKTHPDTMIQDFIHTNPRLQILNAGLVGGNTSDVAAFARHIVHTYCDDQIDHVQKWETKPLGTDMGAFNYVARTRFADQLSYGPHVNNVFKSNTPSKTAWWRHK